MTLKKGFIDLPFINGIDTKLDDKQLKIGQLTDCENISFRHPGKVSKRDAFVYQNNIIQDTGVSITSGRALAVYKNELLAFSNTDVYTLNNAANEWKDKGDFVSSVVTSSSITNGTAQDFGGQEVLATTGQKCIVWMRKVGASTNSYMQVVDSTTGAVVYPTTKLLSGSQEPRVTIWRTNFVIHVFNGSRIYRALIPFNSLATPAFFSVTTAAGNTAIDPSIPKYDVVTSPDYENFYIAFQNLTGGITVQYYADASISIVTAQQVITPVVMNSCQLIWINELANPGPGFFYTNTGPGPAVWTSRTYQTDLTPISTRNTTFPGYPELHWITATEETGGSGRQVSVFVNGYSGLNIAWNALTTYLIGEYVEYDGNSYKALATSTGVIPGTNPAIWYNLGAEDTYFLRKYTGDTVSTYTLEWQILDVVIHGAAYVYNLESYLPAQNYVNITPSNFHLGPSGQVVARFLTNLGQGPNIHTDTAEIYDLPTTITLGTGKYGTPFKTLVSSQEVSGVQTTGLVEIAVDYAANTSNYQTATAGGVLLVNGGFLNAYDGTSFAELGFHYTPTIISAVPSPGASTINHTYLYKACYEWTDNDGNLVRSAPSLPVTVYTTTDEIGVGGQVVNLKVESLHLTSKPSSEVLIVLYRTKDNLPDYFRIGVTTANYNTILTKTVSIQDSTLDTDLVEPIYTTTEVPNSAPPVPGPMAVYRNRVFVVDSTNPLNLYYSKIVNSAAAVDFYALAKIEVDPTGGAITGLAVLDDKLLIFKENYVRQITGNGPDALNQNSDYEGTNLITSDAGCNNPRSIVNSPEGVFFKSPKGLYFINRGLAVSYKGAPVEAYNDDTITSSVLMNINNQIRFTLNTSSMIVYDYYVDQWLTFTSPSGIFDSTGSVVYNDAHWLINSTGSISKETVGDYLDGVQDVNYSMMITTGWINLGGIQGFARLYKNSIIGEWISEHNVTVGYYFDWSPQGTQIVTIVPIIPGLPGSDVPGANVAPYGGYVQPYQYQTSPNRQKMDTFKLRIVEVPLDTGASCTWSSLRLSYGVMPGGNRVRNIQTFG